MDINMQVKIFSTWQGKSFLSAYKKCIASDSIDAIGIRLLEEIPKKPTAKDCTVLANYMLLFSQMASLNVLQQLYKELKTFKAAAKVLPTLEADATLMSKLNGSEENLQ